MACIPDGLITNWRYVKQEPIVLSGSVSSNLDPAVMGILFDDMTNLLAQLGLEALLPLSVGWQGGKGASGESATSLSARYFISRKSVAC